MNIKLTCDEADMGGSFLSELDFLVGLIVVLFEEANLVQDVVDRYRCGA